MYWHCKFDEFSTSHLQRYKALIFGCLILQRENCYTPTKEIDCLWVKNMICKLSKIWLISQYFQRHTDVEILSSFGWHVFNVLLTLKFWRVFDVMFSTSYWHWNSDESWLQFFNVQLTLIFGCSTSLTKFNVFSTLVQHHMPAG